MNGDLERRFPGLGGTGYTVTSPPQVDYNCIAWAAGDDSRWWEPSPSYFWPEAAPRQYTLQAYVEAFMCIGFELCQDAALEAGWEKIAIFASADGRPTHAARQLLDGTWTSKLGRLEDIRHLELDHVSGTDYGRPVRFLRRRRAGFSDGKSDDDTP